jgi:adenosylcobinamide-GDP ribazoletransferase
VGLVIGLILVGLDQLLSLILSSALVDALLILSLVIITGALHLDGFIDTCDGLVSGKSPQERLEVMADSRTGSFGVVGVYCLLGLKYAALISVPGAMRLAALLLMPVLSRWTMVYAVVAFPYARKSLGKGYSFSQQASWRKMALATFFALALSLWLMPPMGIGLMAVVWLIIFGVASYLKRRLGGLTGDTYGAINELAELLVLILIPVLAGI